MTGLLIPHLPPDPAVFQHIYVGEVLTNKDIRGIMMVPMWSAATSNDFPSKARDPLFLCCGAVLDFGTVFVINIFKI